MSKWKPIETASKTPDSTGLYAPIILGFAPDEENYTLPSCEGRWSEELKCWVSTLDPGWSGLGPPTHWQPLPKPPNT